MVDGADRVMCPVIGVDIIVAIEYIRDHELLTKFKEDYQTKGCCYNELSITLPDRSKFGRPTPRLKLYLEYTRDTNREFEEDDLIKGKLTCVYNGEYEILSFKTQMSWVGS